MRFLRKTLELLPDRIAIFITRLIVSFNHMRRYKMPYCCAYEGCVKFEKSIASVMYLLVDHNIKMSKGELDALLGAINDPTLMLSQEILDVAQRIKEEGY